MVLQHGILNMLRHDCVLRYRAASRIWDMGCGVFGVGWKIHPVKLR
jgi:hypothetical protein